MGKKIKSIHRLKFQRELIGNNGLSSIKHLISELQSKKNIFPVYTNEYFKRMHQKFINYP